jgi:small subunit ribosomal protein S1
VTGLRDEDSWRKTVEEHALSRQQDEPSMAELFREVEDQQQPRRGDIRRGIITAVSDQGVTVDIQARNVGLVPLADLAKLPPAERESLREGQTVVVYVTDEEDAQGLVQLSLYLATKEQDWLRAEELLQQGRLWEGRVSGYNKGGLVVPFGHIRGFVPASQVTGFPRRVAGEEKLAQLARFVGQQLAFQVVEVDRRGRRLVLSERLGRGAKKSQEQKRVLAELRKGDLCQGRVRALTEYGAFVDLGGMVGLIHRTELAWFRVEHPCEILQEGQEVQALVLRVSRDRGRVSLSLKRTYDDPWPTVLERYQLGQPVEGRVIRRTGAGLFLITGDGILGFVTEADIRQGGRPEEELAIGRQILTRLVRVDGARRRLGLSLRRVRTGELEEWRKRVEQPTESSAGTDSPTAPSEE